MDFKDGQQLSSGDPRQRVQAIRSLAADFIEEFWWLTPRRVWHIRSPPWRPESADN